MDQLIFLDLTDKIQHLLRSAHCKCRNDHVTAPVKGLLDHIRQILNIVRSRSMAAITIGRLHHHIICILNILRIPDQWLMFITNVTGKYDLFLHAIFFYPDFNRRGSQEMSRIYKPNRNPFCNPLFFHVTASYKALHDSLCILYSVHRYIFFPACTSSLTITPFCLEHLNVCTVSKHDIA